MKARFRRMGRILFVSVIACVVMAGTVLAASTVTLTAPADGATAVDGSVTLDTGTGATLGTGHTYTVDGGAAQALTVTGSAFSVPVGALADGSHTVGVTVKVDEDGAGAGAAVDRSATRTFTMAAGAVDVAAPGAGGGLAFSIPTAGLGQSVSDSMSSLSPLFTIAAGLVIAGAALGWGISMIKKWRAG